MKDLEDTELNGAYKKVATIDYARRELDDLRIKYDVDILAEAIESYVASSRVINPIKKES